jgi:DNA-directed RNA polymerase subunit RPC12/RpoP
MALKRLYEFIVALMNPLRAHELPAECARVEEIKQDTAEDRPSFAQKTFALEDLLYVNKCAYFDYQRDKVVFRTHPHLRHRKSTRGGIDPSTLRPNTTIIVEKQRCPTCQSKRLREKHLSDYFVLDLKFAKTGVRRFVTKLSARNYLCLKCKYPFSARGGPRKSDQIRPISSRMVRVLQRSMLPEFGPDWENCTRPLPNSITTSGGK